MDMARGPGEQRGEDDRDGIGGETVAIGTDERRMQVRAYNHWIALLRGQSCPAIADLDPAGIADFGPYSVLLDFTAGVADPAIRFLGHALRTECGASDSITRLSEVPARSLLSRLTDHYLQIIANRAPIGFEAEFTGTRGFPMMYRGILMPFSSDGEAIDYLYGVINWKEVVDAATQSQLLAELEESRRVTPRPTPGAAVWADGPSAGLSDLSTDADTLADRLATARTAADSARLAGGGAPGALVEALAQAHDLVIAAGREPAVFAALLDDAGMPPVTDTPVESVARLVFGGARLADHVALLGAARRHGVAEGGFGAWVAAHPGGLPALVADAAPPPSPTDHARMAQAVATVPIAPGDDEFVLLLARAAGSGSVAVLGRVDGDPATLTRAIAQLAA
ncbi:hypothetical protein ASG37_15810 [Sphingomonas sp. Leaf407]|nr:hypothetical protein ASE97_15065 [Sphingomonas sp. Leaf42]KQT25337.1 hypothetical protein ASG37_15810 [Sphingomonas sp. Leaf407]